MDAATVRREAARAGFRATEYERVARLTAILSTLMEHPFLRDRLALKGGTALNIYHRHEVPRLSVDGDLNYIGQVEREATEVEIPRLWSAIEAVAKEAGYPWNLESRSARFRTYRLSYTNVHGTKGSLRLDVNLIERVPVLLPVARLLAPDTFGTNGPVACLQLEEVAGMKIAALLGRTAARDYWDVATLPELDWGRVRKIAIFYGLQYDALLTHWPARIAGIQELAAKALANEVTPLLRQGATQNPADLLAAVQTRVKDLMPLSAAEQAVLDDLRKGTWNANAWFEGTWHNAMLDRHPGILKAMHEAQAK